MKTNFLIILFLTFSVTGFAQKKALKAAEKAIKSGDIATAKDALKAAEGQLEAADDGMKSNFYYLKGQALAAGGQNASLEDLEASANAYAKAIEIGGKVAPKATDALSVVRNSIVNSAIEDQNAKNYKSAAKKLYLGYTTNKADTLYLYYAAGNAVNGKDYETALDYYGQLKALGYDGTTEEFVATDKTSGEVKNFSSKTERDLMVKSGQFIKPEIKKSESKKGEIAKNTALIYVQQGKDEEAIKAIEDAKAANPGDASLLQVEADIAYRMGNLEKYKEIMEQVVASDPENPDLYYNIGVSAGQLGNLDQAQEYYMKALELKPDYASAQINLAALILGKETKIVEEMNGLGTSSKDYKRYDELKGQKEGLYKEAVPYLEGALKSNPDNVEAVRTLMNIYYQLDDPKADVMKEKLKAIEGGN